MFLRAFEQNTDILQVVRLHLVFVFRSLLLSDPLLFALNVMEKKMSKINTYCVSYGHEKNRFRHFDTL